MLENKTILKVGIDGWRDIEKFVDKYQFDTKGTLDLRFLAEACGYRPLGLEYLAHEHLGINLVENDHEKWEDEEIDSSSRIYAAQCAFASIELFKYFANRLRPEGLRMPLNCLGVLGRDRVDVRYIYRSDLDRPNGGDMTQRTEESESCCVM